MSLRHRVFAAVPVTEPGEYLESDETASADPIGTDPVDLGPAYVDDGLASELARAQPRRWGNGVTPWLVAAVLLVGGFAAGAQTQRTYGPQAPAAAATTSRNGGQLGGRTGGFPGAAGAGSGATAAPGGPATTGTVKLMDGTTLYVQTQSGDVVTVRTNGSTAVQVPGKLGDLKPGDRVSVQGQPAGDGELTASTVTGRR